MVFLYFPVRGEVDVSSLVHKALLEGKTVAFPRVEGVRIRFYSVKNLSELKPGFRGIPEPPRRPDRLAIPAGDGIMVVPGTVFAPDGARLGSGGGYYDRLLCGCRCTTVGVAFGFQVMAGIPVGPRDVSVDAVITERRIFLGSGG